MEFYLNKSLENLKILIPYNEWICDEKCTDTHLVEVIEEWKTIPIYNNAYMASSFGRIKSVTRTIHKSNGVYFSRQGQIFTQSFDKRGYLRVGLSEDGEQHTNMVHRMVSLAFHPNPENKRTVNHKIPIKTKNIVNNLEWSTDKENKAHAMENGLAVIHHHGFGKEHPCSKPIYQLNLDGSLVKEWSCCEETKRSGYNECCVRNVLKGRQWQYKGFFWRYAS